MNVGALGLGLGFLGILGSTGYIVGTHIKTPDIVAEVQSIDWNLDHPQFSLDDLPNVSLEKLIDSIKAFNHRRDSLISSPEYVQEKNNYDLEEERILNLYSNLLAGNSVLMGISLVPLFLGFSRRSKPNV